VEFEGRLAAVRLSKQTLDLQLAVTGMAASKYRSKNRSRWRVAIFTVIRVILGSGRQIDAPAQRYERPSDLTVASSLLGTPVWRLWGQ
jgi:hypothetical protein